MCVCAHCRGVLRVQCLCVSVVGRGQSDSGSAFLEWASNREGTRAGSGGGWQEMKLTNGQK